MVVEVRQPSAQLSVGEFEALAEFTAREIETVFLEFIGGRLGVRKARNGNHGAVAAWLACRCLEARPGLGLHPNLGLRVEEHGEGRALPDGVLAPKGSFAGQGAWADPGTALMTVEITSHDPDTHHRDRVAKPRSYAGAGIPLYLLVDRDTRWTAVHSDPDPALGYRDVHMVRFGGTLTLPEPLGIALDTEELQQYVD
ncbi:MULTISPECIES: Uma2 family endonuclease [unclassified Streptomyces]|uniref:Uma2 family endonuclease n=1 Tax=unclassified Streptomyces TaxID=2593676 RepID=UPI0033BD5686